MQNMVDEMNSAGVHNRKFANQTRRTNAEEQRRKERRRKGRKRHDTYDDDDDDEEGEDEEKRYGSRRREEVLPKWKLCLVGAAIFLCFALLFPSVFSPMLSNLFGGGAHRQQSTATDRPMHPSMMGPNQQKVEDRPHRPPPHHPGASMRMPDMHNQQQQQQQGGFWSGKSGGGTLAWMLPFYTVGVVCFLLYTLFKSKNKRQKRRRDRPFDLLCGEEEDNDDGEDTEDGLEFGVRGDKLRSVQNRLRKTEQAMADILSQLEQISAHSQHIGDPKEAQQKVNVPNIAKNDAQRAEEKAEQQQQPIGTTTADGTQTAGISEKQSAKVEQSLRELKMLSELCKSDRRLRRKLRAAAQRQQNHSSSSSSTNSEYDFEDDEAEEEEEEEEQQETMGKEWEEEEEEGNVRESESEEEGKRSEKPH